MCGVRREAEVAADAAAAPACARDRGGTARTTSSPHTAVRVHRAERASPGPRTTRRTDAAYGTPPDAHRTHMLLLQVITGLLQGVKAGLNNKSFSCQGCSKCLRRFKHK